ncbi:MucB/RseB C-terminal domain-containing protein [Steroidobacter denitrificans]|nr:MucB/RseB C-terminal domain-containing protein [Steroidobacter denitrificans]
MHKYSLLLLLLVSAAGARGDDGDREARAWLERMSQAISTRNYDGRFFHLRGSSSETMRIIHRVDRGRVTERLVSLDGSGREVIRTQNEVICYLPDRRTVLVDRRKETGTLISTVPRYSEDLEVHYKIERGPSTKMLGRRTQIISVQPRDQFRYGYRLWLDHETAMPLKSQLCDSHGNVIEQILFAEVNFKERIPAAALESAVSGEGYTWIRQDVQSPRLSRSVEWSVMRLPAGFRLTAWRLQIVAGSNTPVQHLVYSDGLATVSVFIEPRNPDTEAMNGLSKVGAAFAFSRRLDGHQVTAVGEVPPATVEAIAAGVTKDGATAVHSPDVAPVP